MKTRLRAFAHRHRVEIKYVVIGVVIIGILIGIDRSGVLGNLDHTVVDILKASRGLGAVGMFLLALVSNCAVFVQVPYTLPLLSTALGGASLSHMIVLGVAAGIGAGFGECIKYHVAHRVLSERPNLHHSSLYRWVLRQAHEKPKHLKWIVFIWAASVIPDDTVIIPLALIHYGIRKVAVPLFTGKVFHNVVFAIIFFEFSKEMKSVVEGGLRIDIAFILIVTFLLVIAYQIEKAKHVQKDEHAAEEAEAEAEAVTGESAPTAD